MDFKTITVENGLSNNFVRTIYKDKAGFIWLGTLEGLDRFDGVEIKSYSKKAMGNRESVTALCEDENNILWIGTENGLFRFDKENNKSKKIQLGSNVTKIQSLISSVDQKLYIGTNKGLFIIDDKNSKVQHLTFPKSPFADINNITGIVSDGSKNLWISTLQGLINFNLNKHDIFLYREQAGDWNSFSGITIDGSNLYLATKTREILVFDTKYRKFSSLGIISNNDILTISGDGDNRVFAGTDGDGLKILNISNRQISTIYHDVDDPASISSNSIYSFLYDDKGNYWIGTFSAGLNYGSTLHKKFKSFSVFSKNYFLKKGIRSLYISEDEKFIGTRDGFLYVPGHGKNILEFKAGKSLLRSNIILTVYPFNEKILLGTYGGGISVFDKKTGRLSNFIESDDFTKGSVYGFAEDKHRNLWIATLKGIYKYVGTGKPLDHFTAENSELVSNEVFSITIDSRGRIWAGTMNGFGILDPVNRKFTHFVLPPSFQNAYKTAYIYEDDSRNLWFCTEKGGLFKISGDLLNIRHFSVEDGLPDNSVCSIIEDNKGKYWISTLKGFGYFSPSSSVFRGYTLSDGLPGLSFNPGAVQSVSGGELWWGNEKGLIYFHPDSIADKKYQPEIRITGFYLAGKEVEPGEDSPLKSSVETIPEIILGNRQSSIGFKFVALNYINPLDNHYACKLEGFDKEWKQLGDKNEIHYGKLSSGTYFFRVRLSNSDENSYRQVKVVIRPAYYLIPYIIAGILVFLGIAVWVKKSYIDKLKKQPVQVIQTPATPVIHDKYKTSKLPEETGIIIRDTLLSYMEEKKPYLNSELKLADLANEINYSVHEISQVLNQYQNQHFSDFVNTYRVEEVKKRMSDDTYSKFTLTAIAQQCGFNSKTSFFRVFKKITGKTPADHFKESRSLLNEE